jgi:Flp pilus assembly protein TadB
VPAIDSSIALVASIPFISLIYVLGIVTDRLIDRLYDKRDDTFLKQFYKQDADTDVSISDLKKKHHEERRTVINTHERMADMIEYNRSRLRICRSWSVHALIIACLIPFFAVTNLSPQYALNVSIFGFVVFIALSISCYYTWVLLNKTLYKKTNEQYSFILEEEEKKAKSSSHNRNDN